MRLPSAALALAVALLVPCSACKDSKPQRDDKPVAPPSASVRIDPNTETMTVTSEAGSQTFVRGGSSVPEDFPKSVPLYPNARVVFASKAAKASKPAWSATLETGDATDVVARFYKTSARDLTMKSDMPLGDDTEMMVLEGGALDVTVMIAKQIDEKTGITINVAQR